jgi:CRISPR/Cas system-associated endonuclease Cas3-HD
VGKRTILAWWKDPACVGVMAEAEAEAEPVVQRAADSQSRRAVGCQ